jgi:hypothetical protein
VAGRNNVPQEPCVGCCLSATIPCVALCQPIDRTVCAFLASPRCVRVPADVLDSAVCFLAPPHAGARCRASMPPADALSHAMQGHPRDWPQLTCLSWAQAALSWQQAVGHLVEPSPAAPMGLQILKVGKGVRHDC